MNGKLQLKKQAEFNEINRWLFIFLTEKVLLVYKVFVNCGTH